MGKLLSCLSNIAKIDGIGCNLCLQCMDIYTRRNNEKKNDVDVQTKIYLACYKQIGVFSKMCVHTNNSHYKFTQCLIYHWMNLFMKNIQ